jgi:hypothetical protein
MEKSEKSYFCTKIIDGINVECGEKDKDKFVKGRYSCCISCRNEYMKKYNKKVQEIKKTEMSYSTIQKLNNCVENLGDNIKEMVTSILVSETLPSMDLPIKLHLDDIEDKFSQNEKYFDTFHGKINKLTEDNKKLMERNKFLEHRIEEIQKSISYLLNK